MADIQEYKHSLRELDRVLRRSAESWWLRAMFFRGSTFVVGILAIFLPSLSQSATIVVLFTVIAELCLWQNRVIRDTWETLHRELDARDSFGWPISKAEVSDLLTQIPQNVKSKLSNQVTEDEYFASIQEFGPKRAAENIQESAWWTKHIARKTGDIYTSIVAFLVVGSFITLIISIQTIKNFDLLANIGRVVTSAIILVFSLDLLRTSLAYYKYSRQAATIEERAEQLLSKKSVDMIQAIKLMQDYHLARAAAPMNPEWVWNLKRNDLNELWRTYRRKS